MPNSGAAVAKIVVFTLTKANGTTECKVFVQPAPPAAEQPPSELVFDDGKASAAFTPGWYRLLLAGAGPPNCTANIAFSEGGKPLRGDFKSTNKTTTVGWTDGTEFQAI